jgi:hypothetical protein
MDEQYPDHHQLTLPRSLTATIPPLGIVQRQDDRCYRTGAEEGEGERERERGGEVIETCKSKVCDIAFHCTIHLSAESESEAPSSFRFTIVRLPHGPWHSIPSEESHTMTLLMETNSRASERDCIFG